MSDTLTPVPACSCCSVHHALTVADRARVVTALQVARDRGDSDRAGYLEQRLDTCTTAGRPRVEQRPRVKPIRRSAWRFGGAR